MESIHRRGTYVDNQIGLKLSSLGLALAASVLVGCTGSNSSSGSSSSSGVTISGAINVSASSQKAQLLNSDKMTTLTDLTTYTVSCSTLTPPVQTGSVSLNADGTFSVTIPDGLNESMSCHMVDANGDNVGDFLVSDSSQQDMNGNNQVSSTIAVSGDANLGTIDYDADAQEVTVPKANVASVIVSSTPAAASVFDPTGEWTITTADFTLPPGVKSVCPSGGGNCDGPPDGQTVYMKLWKGSVVSDSSDVYGLQLWDSHAAYNTCGQKVGLPAQVQADMGIDFSANGSANSDFSFTSSINGFMDQTTSSLTNVNISSGWKMDTAESLHPFQTACGPKDININGVMYSNAWKCGPDTVSTHSQYQLGGGCKVTSTQLPVNVTDWSSMNCGSGPAFDSATGVFTQTCTGTANSVAVTCVNKYAVTEEVGGHDSVILSQGSATFDWSNMSGSEVAQGTSCASFPMTSGGTEKEKIAQAQCYADYYYQSGMANNDDACMPKVNTDWSATTLAEFAHVDFRPSKLAFFEQYKPNSSGDGGSILSREERYEGVQVNGNNYVNCRVIQTGGLSFKKISDTKMLAIYQSSRITTSNQKPACVAEFSGKRETFMFYLNK